MRSAWWWCSAVRGGGTDAVLRTVGPSVNAHPIIATAAYSGGLLEDRGRETLVGRGDLGRQQSRNRERHNVYHVFRAFLIRENLAPLSIHHAVPYGSGPTTAVARATSSLRELCPPSDVSE